MLLHNIFLTFLIFIVQIDKNSMISQQEREIFPVKGVINNEISGRKNQKYLPVGT